MKVKVGDKFLKLGKPLSDLECYFEALEIMMRKKPRKIEVRDLIIRVKGVKSACCGADVIVDPGSISEENPNGCRQLCERCEREVDAKFRPGPNEPLYYYDKGKTYPGEHEPKGNCIFCNTNEGGPVVFHYGGYPVICYSCSSSCSHVMKDKRSQGALSYKPKRDNEGALGDLTCNFCGYSKKEMIYTNEKKAICKECLEYAAYGLRACPIVHDDMEI